MSNADQTFCETMRRLRKAQGITLEALQQRTGVPAARLREIDGGTKAPYLSEAQRIAAALGTTVDALINGYVTTYALGAFRNIANRLPLNRQDYRQDNRQDQFIE